VVLFRLEEVGSASAADPPTAVALPAAAPPATKLPVAPRPQEPRPTARAARLARRQWKQRPGPAPRRRRGERFAKPVAALIAIVLVLFLVGGGGYLATRQLFFVGTNSQGIVTIYRGLPYDLPFGIRLYESFYVSGVPASLVPADRRSSFFNDHLRSQTSADNLVRDLELGKVSQ
jgi:hypothetical protein